MRSKTLILRILVVSFCFLSILGLGKSFGEKQEKSDDKTETSAIAFQQALKNFDLQKQKEQEEMASELNFCLGRTIENWINTAKNDKAGKLNTYLDLDWNQLELFYSVPSIRYEFYLRGYKYSVLKTDIDKTDSITSPYKAMVTIKEELYAEKYHPPNISDANPYFYTITSNYILNLEYKNENFILVRSDNRIISMEKDCPAEIKRLFYN